MSFDPTAEQFEWPEPTELSNSAGATMRISPCAISNDIDQCENDRQKECRRFYQTPIGVWTELEVKYWQIGGPEPCTQLICDLREILNAAVDSRISIVEAENALAHKGHDPIVISVCLGWLIKGKYVNHNLRTMQLERAKPT